MTATSTATRPAIVVFAVLAAATVGAFFLAQRVKSTPSVITQFTVTPLCSPNGDGRLDGCRAGFRLKRRDDVTVSVVNSGGDAVATLVSNHALAKKALLRVLWKGRTSSGARAPDGMYRFRVTLRDQGRSILLPHSIRVDTTPPRPEVTSIGPLRTTVPRPELFPNPQGKPLQIHVATPTSSPTEVFVYRTDPSPSPQPVAVLPPLHGSGTVTWDGTVHGAKVRPGTYVVALRTRDAAGNIGTSPSALPPHAGYGQTLPGHGGITIRYLGVQPPLEPVVAGERASFGVDARRQPYTWSLRRAGESHPRKSGAGTRPVLGLQVPKGESGLFVLDVRTRAHGTSVPLVSQALKHHSILVVLPAILWQGTNPVDDDGDGMINTLTSGVSVRRDRVLAGGLPDELVKQVAPLLIFLDRHRMRYDLTTDLALAAGDGPPVEGHSGVVLAGDERWLPARTQKGLAAWVQRGGKLATFGTDSLERGLRITRRRMLDPTTPSPTDAFGFSLRPIVDRTTTVTIADDKIGLFKGDVLGGTGVFRGYPAFEATAALPPGARSLARATTPAGQSVILAAKVGKGLVIRTGLPDFASRLSSGGNEQDLVTRIWGLLAP